MLLGRTILKQNNDKSKQLSVHIIRYEAPILYKSKLIVVHYNKTVCASFISCYFNYCCVLWHFCNNSDTLKIEKLQ